MRRLTGYPYFATEDPDHAAEVMSAALNRYQILSARRPFFVRAHSAPVDQLAVSLIESSAGLTVDTENNDRYCVTVFFEQGGVERAVNGRRPIVVATGQGVMTCPASRTITQCSQENRVLTVRAPAEWVHQMLRFRTGLPPDKRPFEIAAILGANSPVGRQAYALLTALASGPVDPALARELQHNYLRALVEDTDNTWRSLLDRPTRGVSVPELYRAEELLRANPGRMVSVEEVAEHLDRSVRSVQLGYQRRFDRTFTEVYRLIRLGDARQRLEQPRPGDTVGSIGRRFGFHHRGEFAGYYSQAFGELPSTTLHRGKKRM